MTSFLANLWTAVSGARQVVEGAPVRRQIAAMIPKARVALDEDPAPDLVRGEPFTPGGCYFGIRLAGLHLTHARRYAKEQLPLCVCMSEFSRAGEQRTVPFSVGPGIIRDRLQNAGVRDAEGADQAWIELRDITVVRPTPVSNSNLSLFVGLYSVPGDDLVRTLLNVVGDLGGSLGAAALGPAVKVAESVYGGFSSLLRMEPVKPKVEALNGRALAQTGSGYLLVGNADAAALDGRALSVRRGALCEGDGKEIVTDFDYCLIAIERHASLVEQAAGLAPELFGETWRDTLTALAEGNSEAAARMRERLLSAILSTPDLIEADRDLLVAGYLALYHKRAEQLAGARGATRGGEGDLATTVSLLSQSVHERDPALSDALDAVYKQMTDTKGRIAAAAAPDGDEVVREAVALRGRLKPTGTPGSLAFALARASAAVAGS
jgi:hypothetical protein